MEVEDQLSFKFVFISIAKRENAFGKKSANSIGETVHLAQKGKSQHESLEEKATKEDMEERL
jgi:hypothetical protein